MTLFWKSELCPKRSSAILEYLLESAQHARANLDKAVAEKLPIFGFEVEPNKAAQEREERSVKHFYLDRAHQLKDRIDLTLHKLEKRLRIEDTFRKRGIADEGDPNLPISLFELVGTTVEPPAAGDYRIENAREEHEVDLPLEGNRSANVYARKVLPILVAHVLQQQDGVMVPITYRFLAELQLVHSSSYESIEHSRTWF